MEANRSIKTKRQRYGLLDSIRGLVLISMILYHACWDLVYIFGKDWKWYRGAGAYVWQQSICWSFILLSGFCWSLGKNHLKRGILVFAAGGAVSLVTILFMPENRVVFGVLTLIGCCVILMIPVNRVLKKLSPGIGILGSAGLFFLTRGINEGYLGFEGWEFLRLPAFLYRGSMMTFLGFPALEFFSTDYFSLFPWFFLYLTGYFLYGLLEEETRRERVNQILIKEWAPLSFLGRHSLILYMLHQPLIYGILLLIF